MISTISAFRNRPLRGLKLTLLALVTLLAHAPAAPAADNLALSATLELSQIYQPDVWQPVRFELRNPTDRAVDGALVLPLNHPAHPAVIRLPITVPPHSRVAAALAAYFPPPAPATSRTAAQRSLPPLSVAEWRSPDGGLLARADVLGAPLSAQSSPDTDSPDPGHLILLLSNRPESADDAYDPTPLVSHLRKSASAPLAVAAVPLDTLPRNPAALRPLKAVILDAVDPDSLDLAQRSALVDYLRTGGTLILSAPVHSASRPGSWLDAIRPARPVGTRLTSQIPSSNPTHPLKFTSPLPIVEALPSPDSTPLLRDDHYVHVATRPVGLGRVVFTSFPANALDPAQPAVAQLWSHLLALDRPRWDWSASALGDARHALLSSMIGRAVAPWSLAASFALGYVALLLAAQFLFRGPSRPRAFAASIAAAVLLSGLLVAMGMTRRADQSLQSARLSILDLAPDGGGWRHESLAFVGLDAPDLSLTPTHPHADLRPALADPSDPPQLRQRPFAVERAGVAAERIDRVWQSSAPADPAWKFAPVARFADAGLSLHVDHSLPAALESPLIIWNHHALAAPDLPPGPSDPAPLTPNNRGDYTNANLVTSDLAKRRAQVIAASLAPPADQVSSTTAPPPAPALVAWLPGPAVPALVRPSADQPADEKTLVMVRAPLRIEPPAPGSTLRIPAPFVTLSPGRMPYQPDKDESVPSQQDGQFLVSFSPPPQLGPLRPSRVTLTLRLTLPAHTLEIRRAQVIDGKPTLNRNGPAAASWSNQLGAQTLTFDPAPTDYDAQGRLHLLLDIHATDPSAGSQPLPWQLHDLSLSLDQATSLAPASPLPVGWAPPTTPTPGTQTAVSSLHPSSFILHP